MDLRKASRIMDSGRVNITDQKTGEEEKRKIHNFFKGNKRISDSQQIKDELEQAQGSIKSLKMKLASKGRVIDTQKKQIRTLKRRIKDAEEREAQFQQIAQTFKSEKAENESKLIELQHQLDQARQVEMPLKIEYSTVEQKLQLGSEEKENVSFEEFTTLLTTISAIFPDIRVKLTVEEIEEEAHKVKDSIDQSKWDKASLKKFLELCDSYCKNPTEESIKALTECASTYGTETLISQCQGLQPAVQDPASCILPLKAEVAFDVARLQPIADDQNDVQRVASEIEDYLVSFDDTILKQELEADIPNGLKQVVDLIVKNGYLTEHEYEELKPQVQQELKEAKASITSFALIKDSRIYTLDEFENRIKDSLQEVKDAYNRIPGTPTRFRIADTDFRKGFSDEASSIKAGSLYIIYQ